MRPEARLADLGWVLPVAPAPRANYLSCVRTGSLLFVAGHGPVRPEGGMVTGKVGDGHLPIGVAKDAARLTALAMCASIHESLGSLDVVSRVVSLRVMVNCAPGFNQMPFVADGASDVFVALWGEAGRHARTAVGMAELPFDIAVEIDGVFELGPLP